MVMHNTKSNTLLSFLLKKRVTICTCIGPISIACNQIFEVAQKGQQLVVWELHGFHGGNLVRFEDDSEVHWISGFSDGTMGIAVSDGALGIWGNVCPMGQTSGILILQWVPFLSFSLRNFHLFFLLAQSLAYHFGLTIGQCVSSILYHLLAGWSKWVDLFVRLPLQIANMNCFINSGPRESD